MGDTGPCGPCSEIFFDHGDQYWGGLPGTPEEDGDRFIEIWNLVFMQFEQVTLEERVNLPKPSIDTGMGLERIAAVLQGTNDNYQTDLFRALISALRPMRPVSIPDGPQAASHKVIADHLRASSFLLADGVEPSNAGRGYVLRRIMRRAMRHAQLLGAKDPLMHRLVPALVREMGEAYPELIRAQPMITETLEREETQFRKTLARGMGLLDDESASLKEGDVFSGETAFKLHDTYGFPLDLTQDALRPRGITIDTDAFDAAMERQKEIARKAFKGSGDAATETLWFDIREREGVTEFLGYETETAEGVITALAGYGEDASGSRELNEVEQLSEGAEGVLVLNQTPFYGESGGQQGDTGEIRGEGGAVFRVTNTQKRLGDVFVHIGTVEKGSFKTGGAVELDVDHARRTAIRANHSATHLIHEALRQVLGEHVAQKGSLVAPDRLRFDFSHTKPIAEDELVDIERLANDIVTQNGPVETRLMPYDEALETGAMALFGEKYGDEVRVVMMGTGIEGAKENKPWSVELCGGTHVARTGDIGLIRIVTETASASGVRRIEALTADGARNYLAEQDERMRQLGAVLRTRPEDVVGRVEALVEERRQLERQLAEAKRQLALGGGSAGNGAAAGDAIEDVGGVKLLARSVEGLNPKDLRGLVDDGKSQVQSGVVAIVGVTEDGKAGLAVGVTDDLTKTYSAVDLVRAGSEALGGKGGGGRPDMAQAGGPIRRHQGRWRLPHWPRSVPPWHRSARTAWLWHVQRRAPGPVCVIVKQMILKRAR